jgi:excisionase family DNA binding protein
MANKNILTEYDDVLRPEDIQQILRIGRNTVYKYLADGEIKSIRIGNQYRIPKQYLIDFLYPQGTAQAIGGM